MTDDQWRRVMRALKRDERRAAAVETLAGWLVCSWRRHDPMLKGVRDPIWLCRRCRTFLGNGHEVILRGRRADD